MYFWNLTDKYSPEEATQHCGNSIVRPANPTLAILLLCSRLCPVFTRAPILGYWDDGKVQAIPVW